MSPRVPKAHVSVREEIPRLEQFLGGLILIGLAALAVVIFLKGRSWDPHRFALDPAALESTRSAVTGKAATLRADDMRGFEQAGGAAATAPQAAGRNLPAMVAGVSPMSATEHYLPDTLFEKINGRAPAYFEFNFQELTCRSFSIDAAPGQFVDVFIFSMDTPLNAFGIFSLEREASAVAVDFARDGYRSEMGYFFRQGSAYVQILASDSAAAVMAPAEAFARSLAASIPADDTGLDARALLPAANQVPDSVSYLQGDAYGLSRFKNVYEAQYAVGGARLTFFVMQVPAAAEAALAWAQLEAFNRDYARITDQGQLAGAAFLISDNFGEWSVYFQKGPAIGGVVNAADPDLARRFVEAYLTGAPLPAPAPDAPAPAADPYAEGGTTYE